MVSKLARFCIVVIWGVARADIAYLLYTVHVFELYHPLVRGSHKGLKANAFRIHDKSTTVLRTRAGVRSVRYHL
jgi:hypothetical protein